MTTPKRQRLSPAQRRAQLVDLGVAALADHSLEDVSVEHVAEQAGVTRALVFHYFTSKQEFHAAILDKVAQEVLEATTPDPALAPLDTLRATLGTFIDYVGRNPHVYVSLVRGESSSVPALRQSVERTRGALVGRILDLFGQLGFEGGPLLEFTVRGWLAFTEEVATRWLLDPQGVGRDHILELLAGSLPGVVLAPQLAAPDTVAQLFPEVAGLADPPPPG